MEEEIKACRLWRRIRRLQQLQKKQKTELKIYQQLLKEMVAY